MIDNLKSKDMNYIYQKYTVDFTKDIPYQSALKIWKKKHKSVENIQEIFNKPHQQDFLKHLIEVWDEIPDYNSKDIHLEEDLNIRRLMFDAYGIEDTFKELEPTLISQSDVEFDQIVFDDEGNQTSMVKLPQTFKLYQIEKNKLGLNRDAFIVECECVSTKQKHLIYSDINEWNIRGRDEKDLALFAISKTFDVRYNHKDNEVYRQGDVFIVNENKKIKENKSYINDYHRNLIFQS